MGEWQDISTAPRGKIILMFGYTYELEGGVRNWKLETGSIQRFSDGEEDWYWGGSRLADYDYRPTHWQPLPAPPQ